MTYRQYNQGNFKANNNYTLNLGQCVQLGIHAPKDTRFRINGEIITIGVTGILEIDIRNYKNIYIESITLLTTSPKPNILIDCILDQ